MENYLILLYLGIFTLLIAINKTQEIVPKKLIHGVSQNDTWNINTFYEYYIDISNYELNEENIFEIYGININIDAIDLKIYLLLSNINDEELIKNGTIKPNQKSDEYKISSNNIQYDHLMNKTYFFLPFNKTNSSQNYLIILIKNIHKHKIDTLFYISERMQIINIEQKNPNNVEVYTKDIKTRNDIRLYYKIDISKINITKNNIYLFFDKENIDDYELEFYYTNDLYSLDLYTYNILILEKNKTNYNKFYFNIKNKNNNNIKEILVNLWIRIDDNNFYFIHSEERSEAKLYIENININKDVFIIENYNLKNDSTPKFSILERFYGNFTLKYFEKIKDLNFENLESLNKTDISQKIISLENGLVNIFILKCFTPSAFNFEIFRALNTPDHFTLGQSIKTIISPYEEYYNCIEIKNLNAINEYKVKVRIISKYTNNETLDILIFTQGLKYKISITKPYNVYYQNLYSSDNKEHYTSFCVATYDLIFFEYYFTSNNLISNIAEGSTIINRFLPNTAIKIRKDIPFDYISLTAESKDAIFGHYEMKLINSIDIESETNNLKVGLPQIKMPNSDTINLRISNPYNKFDQIYDINDEENYYYLLLTFDVGSDPIYLNFDYIYNEEVANLSPIKSKIIKPNLEYEVVANNNYRIKDKILFNINKCDNNDKVNYTLINYYENRNNIIKETEIINHNQIFLFDNLYYKSKFILYKNESELNDTKNEEIDIYPANYYNKGDILLNYFLIESSKLKELKFTSDYNIIYKEETWSEIILSWKEYVYINSNNNIKINIATNYSIYILPKNSVVNTICQLSLIPANKSIVNSTEIKLDMDEGEYKIVIIANVIDNEIPFEIMYNFIELKIVKKVNVVLIIIWIFVGLILILLILYIIFRKKIKYLLNKERSSMSIDESKNDIQDEEEEEFEGDDESTEKKLNRELFKLIDK